MIKKLKCIKNLFLEKNIKQNILTRHHRKMYWKYHENVWKNVSHYLWSLTSNMFLNDRKLLCSSYVPVEQHSRDYYQTNLLRLAFCCRWYLSLRTLFIYRKVIIGRMLNEGGVLRLMVAVIGHTTSPTISIGTRSIFKSFLFSSSNCHSNDMLTVCCHAYYFSGKKR